MSAARSSQWVAWGVGLAGAGLAGWIIASGGIARGGVKKHDFTGRCASCHTGIPELGAPYRQARLIDRVERLCARCHALHAQMSHPIGVIPQEPGPLRAYLDEEGRMTCVTCHEVHKEDHVASAGGTAGLLRGHVSGAAFCATCHQEGLPGGGWRHELALARAHLAGRLAQEAQPTVDRVTAECLSCHDGWIARSGQAEIRSGDYQHGIGISHPVGVVYPRNDPGYVPREALPEAITLFDGKVGCVSCHNPYHGYGPNRLTVQITGSALCLTCHRK